METLVFFLKKYIFRAVKQNELDGSAEHGNVAIDIHGLCCEWPVTNIISIVESLYCGIIIIIFQ